MENNYQEVDISAVFIKHDFDHLIVTEDPDEISRYTNGDIGCSTMKQSLVVPYDLDIQILMYFL